MNKIQMLDLKEEYNILKEKINHALEGVLQSGHFILGENVNKLEEEISDFLKVKYAIGVASGTDALYIALRAFNIKEGDEVITTPFTFIATASTIVHCGAKPVFVDINPSTFNISSELIERKVTEKTRAILPVHLFGLPSDMDTICKIAKRYNLIVIEDNAQGFGGMYKGKYLASIGDAGCLSFFPSKNLGAYGDGGMVVTEDQFVAERMKMLRAHGARKKYFNEILGVNSRLDELQAAILRIKLKFINEWNEKRRAIAKKYSELLKNVDFIKLPVEPEDCYHVYHQFTIRVKHRLRDRLKQHLEKDGISTMVYYPYPLHQLPLFNGLGYNKGDFPEAEKASIEVLSLPIGPFLKMEQVEQIAESIKSFK